MNFARDEEDIRQVASTLPERNKKTKKMQGKMNVEQNNNFFIAGAAGAGATGAWNIHVFFVWFWQARKYLLSSSERQACVRSVKLCSATLCTGVFLFYIKRHLMSGMNLHVHSAHRQRKLLGCEHKKRVEKRWRIMRADICPGVYGP